MSTADRHLRGPGPAHPAEQIDELPEECRVTLELASAWRRARERDTVSAMAVRLNHTIVAARDRDASARFLAEMPDLSPPPVIEPFAVVQVGDTSLTSPRAR